MDKEETVCADALNLLGYQHDMSRTERLWSTHSLLAKRLTGQFYVKFNNLRKYPDKFFQVNRMSMASFYEILFFISDSFIKKNTNLKRSKEVVERLVINLRYERLAQSSSIASQI